MYSAVKKNKLRPFSVPFSVPAVALFNLYAQRRAVFSHLDEEDVHFMGQLCCVHLLKVKMQIV
jgi:hypothetical protein